MWIEGKNDSSKNKYFGLVKENSPYNNKVDPSSKSLLISKSYVIELLKHTEHTEKPLESFEPLESLEPLKSLESLKPLESLESLKPLELAIIPLMSYFDLN